MGDLVACNNEEDPIKMIFPDAQWAANSTVQGLIWPNFEPIREFMDVLVACKIEKDSIKNEGDSVVKTLSIIF